MHLRNLDLQANGTPHLVCLQEGSYLTLNLLCDSGYSPLGGLPLVERLTISTLVRLSVYSSNRHLPCTRSAVYSYVSTSGLHHSRKVSLAVTSRVQANFVDSGSLGRSFTLRSTAAGKLSACGCFLQARWHPRMQAALHRCWMV